MSKGLRAARQATKYCAQSPRHASHTAGASEASQVNNKTAFPSSSGFWLSLIIVPIGLVGASYVKSADGKPWLTQLIKSYQFDQDEVDRINSVRTAAYEQAAADRHLFTTAPRSELGFEVRDQESFNRSSPWNVSAGQGGVDLTRLMESYAKKHEREEQRRLDRNGDGEIETVYDDTTEGRFPSWVPYIGTTKKPRTRQSD